MTARPDRKDIYMHLIRTLEQPQLSLFDSMRRGFEYVAGNARFVKIDYQRLASFVRELPDQPPKNVLDSSHHFFGSEEETAGYILTLDSINFGSGFMPGLADEGWKLVNNSIYYTVSTRLKEHFDHKGALSASDLSEITPQEIANILKLPAKGKNSQAFATRCAHALREMGGVVSEEYKGTFMGLVNWAGGSSEKMVRSLIRLAHFNDMHRYHGHAIAFHKRAQITVADLHVAFRKLNNRQLFRDINQLTLFADNAVPHVLRAEGVLNYGKDLAARIEKGKEIPSGAEEEVEIRACAAHAVELIARQKNSIAMNIDHILWHLSVEKKKYQKTPAHRTISDFY
jgi:hypothetical protein